MYTDVFGSQTVPPSESGYISIAVSADTDTSWPEYPTEDTVPLATIVHLNATGSYSLTLPSASQVSVGRDVLLRNVGAEDISVLDYDGGAVHTLTAGTALLVYVADNSDDAGTWGTVAYGVGSSSVDAASLVGYGVKAVGSTLNQAHTVFPTADAITIGATHRSKVLVFTGGTATFTLPSAVSTGNDFFFLVRNQGTGLLTVDPAGSDLIDGNSSFAVSPGESAVICCSGTAWFTVGYGRATEFNFTQLTKDVSAGGTITLSAIEASNKLLTFTGSPAAAVTVVVPSTVQIYYTYNALSTANTVTLKTASGSGVTLNQNDRVICFCDSVNVLSAQSAVATSALSLVDGSAASPALYFASVTNTGLYRHGATGIGFSVGGVAQLYVDDDDEVYVVTNLNTPNVDTTTLNTTKLNGRTLTAAGLALLDDASSTAQRTTLGLGNSATLNTGTTAGTVATGNHNHSGVYQPVGSYQTTNSVLTDLSSNLTATASELNQLDGVTLSSTFAKKSADSNIDMNNFALTEVKTETYNGEYDNGDSGTSKAIAFSNGQKQKLRLTGNVTLTMTFPGVGNYLLKLTQDATGSRTVSWSTGTPGTTRWLGHSGGPTINSSANGVTFISLYYDGTNCYGSCSKVNE